MRAASSLLFIILCFQPLSAFAQRGVVTSAVLLRESGASVAQASAVSIGLRRGISDVDGVTYMHPVDVLSAPTISEELEMAIDELEPIADMVRTGNPRAAYRRADAVVEVFERNLEAVRRSQLVDAYMLAAIGRCRAGERRACEERIRAIIAFRESLEYAPEHYGSDAAENFERARARALSGPRSSLIVETDPPGAEVYIDGISYGPSPARADGLLAGAHYITVKELGYEKLSVRTEVRAGRSNRAHYELVPNERAQLIVSEQAQARIRGELGEPRAGAAIRSLGNTLGTAQVVIGVLRPAAGGQVHVQLYLYHLTTRLLQARKDATVTVDEAGIERTRRLAVELYQGVDLSGGIEAPDDPALLSVQPELHEQWWFWTAIGGGIALIAGAIAIGVAVGEAQPIPDGFIRWGGTLP